MAKSKRRSKHKDLALAWITNWNRYASPSVKLGLIKRGYEVRHQEHPDGEALVVDSRRWRFDWSVPDLGIAVEIDGGNWATRYSKAQGRYIPVGRHTKVEDYIKRNAATEAGWIVLYYTGQMIKEDPTGCVDQVERIIRRKL